MTYRYDYEKRISELLKHKDSLSNERQKLLEKKRLFDERKISTKTFSEFLNGNSFSEKLNEMEKEILYINSQVKNLNKQKSKQQLNKFVSQNRNGIVAITGIFVIAFFIFMGLTNPGITGFFALNSTNETANITNTTININETQINEIPVSNTTTNETEINETINSTTLTNITNETSSIETNITIEDDTNLTINITSNQTNENQTIPQINETDEIELNATTPEIVVNETEEQEEEIIEEIEIEDVYDYSFTLNRILNQNKLMLLETEKKQHIDRIMREYYQEKRNINLIILNSNNELFNLQRTTESDTNLIYLDYDAQPISTIPLCWNLGEIDSITLVSKEELIGFICNPGIGKLGYIEQNEVYEIISKKDLANKKITE